MVKDPSPNYNWGYDGSEPQNLSLALLRHFLNEEQAIKHHKLFSAAVVAQLPPANFEADIYLDRFMEAVTRTDEQDPIHTYSFLDIYIEDNRDKSRSFPISKFIDLPSLPFNSATFAEDSIEHKKIEALYNTGDYRAWEIHCMKKTTRPDLNNPKEKISINIMKMPGTGYVISDNIGDGEYESENKIGRYVFE